MLDNEWSCSAFSYEPSPDWTGYARRAAGFMQALGEVLGAIEWREPTKSGFGRGPEVKPDDVERLRGLLERNQLRDDYGEIMEGGGARLFLLGAAPVGEARRELLIQPRFGHAKRPVTAVAEVTEPAGRTLWSYPDETVADLVARILAAVDGTEAKARDDPLLSLTANSGLPFRRDTASHMFLHQPPDMTDAPPGSRHVPCGAGVLLIVPPGSTDAGTLERMRWVAAALGQDRRRR